MYMVCMSFKALGPTFSEVVCRQPLLLIVVEVACGVFQICYAHSTNCRRRLRLSSISSPKGYLARLTTLEELEACWNKVQPYKSVFLPFFSESMAQAPVLAAKSGTRGEAYWDSHHHAHRAIRSVADDSLKGREKKKLSHPHQNEHRN